MKYTSKELNKKIAEICDNWDIGHGKCIPYVGWYWREVNFDDKNYVFGIIPGEFVGFMENNKWDCDYRDTTPEEWEEIKDALCDAVDTPCKETTEKVWNMIQKVGEQINGT